MDRATLQTLLLALAGALVLLAVVAAFVSAASRRRLRGELAASRAEVGELSRRVHALDEAVAAARAVPAAPAAGRPEREYVITRVGGDVVAATTTTTTASPVAPAPLSAGQFASVAVGESLVRLLSLGYGVRRALSAENRNRIAFEVRREVKRSRKERRREVKQARRHLRTARLDQDAA